MHLAGRTRAAVQAKELQLVHALHRASRRDLYRRIDDIIRKFHDHGGLKYVYQHYALAALHELLEHHRPRRILELGSGTSTAIFADYVRETEAQLVSVDESSKWLDISRRLADIPKDDPRFRLIRADRTVLWDCGYAVEISYSCELEGDFDFIFVDGPSLEVDGFHFHLAANNNAVALVRHGSPKVIIVDKRQGTVNYMLPRLWHRYDTNLSDVLRPRIRPHYNYFTIFTLKDAPDSE